MEPSQPENGGDGIGKQQSRLPNSFVTESVTMKFPVIFTRFEGEGTRLNIHSGTDNAKFILQYSMTGRWNQSSVRGLS